MNLDRMMSAGSQLLSEEGENPEYDRGIAELCTELLGLPIADNVAQVGRVLRRGRCLTLHPEHPYCDLCGENRVRWQFDEIGVCHIDLSLIHRELS
jgi:hypothetical protein